MGQKETTMTVATEEIGGGTLFRRMILVLVAAALMAVMMAVMSAPAFAFANPDSNGNAGSAPGHTQAWDNSRQTIRTQTANDVSAGGGPKQGILAPTNSDHYYQSYGYIGKNK